METNKPISELAVGKAGEYLVCVDRITEGMIAFPAEQGLPYDVVVQSGTRMLRVQVKTTQGARAALPQRRGQIPGYVFNLRRCGKKGRKRYRGDEFDVLALVALDTRQVGYIAAKDMPLCMIVRTENFRGKYQDEVMDVRVKELEALRGQGKTWKELGDLVGCHLSNVAYLMGRRKGGKEIGRRGRYLRDLTWKTEWSQK